ncbi:MAG: SDR family oxidoreductase [Caulobacteraceae bacterium]|nr:SDR family oxidoreductase [Caulobacteraceae bacterium]
MANRFEGKVAVVTGAGRGIGRETALLFAREGAGVVVNDLGGGPLGGGGDPAVAEAVVAEIAAAGGTAVPETSSVASLAGGKRVVEAALDSFGRLDFLVNVAGIARPHRIWELSEEDWDLVHDVNLKAPFATARAAAEPLKRTRGAIVNFSSMSGLGHYAMANYNAAKEGVVGLTRTLARDLGAFGVRANAIRPLSHRSNMAIPEVLETVRYSVEEAGVPPISSEWLSTGGVEPLPQHVAAVVAWLCTEDAAALNGREVFIGGGHVALLQEPQLVRSQFAAAGWTLDALADPAVSRALTWNQRNPFAQGA